MRNLETKAERAAARFAWLEAIALDQRSTPLMMRLAAILSALANDKGEAWPSYETMARLSGAAVVNVRKAVDRMRECGFLEIEKDPRPGRSRVNFYHLAPAGNPQPVWTLYRRLQEEKEVCAHTRSGDEKGVRGHSKGVRQRSERGTPAYPEPLNRPLELEPSSDPNGSAAAFASASHSREWKGSKGEPIPSDFPDAQAMADARIDVEIAGVDIDLAATREAFRRHHYSVRRLLTDWPRSWAMWVEDAIARAEAAA